MNRSATNHGSTNPSHPVDPKEALAKTKQLAGRVVLTALKRSLADKVTHLEKGTVVELYVDELIKDIDAITPHESGIIALSFHEDDSMELCIRLALVDEEYMTELSVPNGYEQDAMNMVMFMRDTALSYARLYAHEHPELHRRCQAILGKDYGLRPYEDYEFRMKYTDKPCKHNVGIVCFYRDKNKKPYLK